MPIFHYDSYLLELELINLWNIVLTHMIDRINLSKLTQWICCKIRLTFTLLNFDHLKVSCFTKWKIYTTVRWWRNFTCMYMKANGHAHFVRRERSNHFPCTCFHRSVCCRRFSMHVKSNISILLFIWLEWK